MPILSLPATLCPTGREFEISQTNLQDILKDIFYSTDLELERFKAFIKKESAEQHSLKGLITLVNDMMITDLNYELQKNDRITFIPALSGG